MSSDLNFKPSELVENAIGDLLTAENYLLITSQVAPNGKLKYNLHWDSVVSREHLLAIAMNTIEESIRKMSTESESDTDEADQSEEIE